MIKKEERRFLSAQSLGLYQKGAFGTRGKALRLEKVLGLSLVEYRVEYRCNK